MLDNPYNIINPRPGFTAPGSEAPLRVVANRLREGLGTAEAVEKACGLSAARVHEIAQGVEPTQGEDQLLRELAQEAETQARAVDPDWDANSIQFRYDFCSIRPRPGFRAPLNEASASGIANALRDGFGNAETVEIACGVAASRVHEIAQGQRATAAEEKALRWLAQEGEMVSRGQYQEFDDLAARYNSPEIGGPETEL